MRLTMMAVAGTIALIIVATGCAVAQDRAELEVDHALTLDFPTPHTDWAQPYALGTTRVLFFTDGRGGRPRPGLMPVRGGPGQRLRGRRQHGPSSAGDSGQRQCRTG